MNSTTFYTNGGGSDGMPEDVSLADIYNLLVGESKCLENGVKSIHNPMSHSPQQNGHQDCDTTSVNIDESTGSSNSLSLVRSEPLGLRYNMQTVHQQQTIDFVDNNIDNLMNSIEDLQNENVYLKHTVNIQERQKSNALKRIEELEWCVHQQQANVQREIKQRMEAQKRVTKLETDVKKQQQQQQQQQGPLLNTDHVDVKLKLKDLQLKVIQLEYEFKKQREMLRDEFSMLPDSNKKVVDLEREVKQQKHALDEEAKKRLELDRVIEELKKQQQQHQDSIARLGQGLTALHRKCDEKQQLNSNNSPTVGKWSELDFPKVGTETSTRQQQQQQQQQQRLPTEDTQKKLKVADQTNAKKVEKITSKFTSKTQVLFDGFDEEPNEDLVKKVIEEVRKLDVDIKESDVQYAKRLGDKVRSRARSIVVRLTSEAKVLELIEERNKMTADRRACGGTCVGLPIIRRCLTEEGINLFHRIQDYQATRRLHAVFTKDGCIFVELTADSDSVMIKSEKQLLTLLRK